MCVRSKTRVYDSAKKNRLPFAVTFVLGGPYRLSAHRPREWYITVNPDRVSPVRCPDDKSSLFPFRGGARRIIAGNKNISAPPRTPPPSPTPSLLTVPSPRGLNCDFRFFEPGNASHFCTAPRPNSGEKICRVIYWRSIQGGASRWCSTNAKSLVFFSL